MTSFFFFENLKNFHSSFLIFLFLKRKEKRFFFIFWSWLSWLNNSCCKTKRGAEFWPPFIVFSFSFFFFAFRSSFFLLPLLLLFTSFFHLDFLLPYTISSLKKHFPKLLNIPSLITLNIFSDPCVLGHFCFIPILWNPFLNFLFLCINGILFWVRSIRPNNFKLHQK